jgi:hypothetical protein
MLIKMRASNQEFKFRRVFDFWHGPLLSLEGSLKHLVEMYKLSLYFKL